MATKVVNEIITNKIRIGGKAPKSIYKGSTEVKKVTKGSTVIYEKGDVTYTFTGSNTGASTSSTSCTFSGNSYKGSSTSVAISASVISGTGTISSITYSGTRYSIKVTIQSGSTTAVKIRVTQSVSGLSADLTCTRTAYINISRIGFRFCGYSWPTYSGIDCRCTNLVLNGVHMEDLWNGGSGQGNHYGSMGGDSRYITALGNHSNATIYYTNENAGSLGSVTNGHIFAASFLFGGTWSGSTEYSGKTWYMHIRDSYSGKTYIAPKTSSLNWQTYTQPSGPIGWQTTFQNITQDATVDLVIDVNWSWSSNWS